MANATPRRERTRGPVLALRAMRGWWIRGVLLAACAAVGVSCGGKSELDKLGSGGSSAGAGSGGGSAQRWQRW